MLPAYNTDQGLSPTTGKIYIPLRYKFYLSQTLAVTWVALSVWLSWPWVRELAAVISLPCALFIIAGVAYVPGYLNALQVSSLLLDRQPPLKVENPSTPVTVLIAAWNESAGIENTL